jgi:hypothetical protein
MGTRAETPYLSVVATARNDNHGGDLLRRMQLFVSGFLEQCRDRALPAELVLVEWNPPPDRPRLAEALSWPRLGGPCRVRIIEVGAAIHGRYEHADRLPLFQMIAKNAGIRRAEGRFVLATNIDILFSDRLMRYLAARRLRPGRMYRVDRHDVPTEIPLAAPLADRFDYCRRHVFRVHAREGTRNLVTGEYHMVHPARDWRGRLRDALETAGLIPVEHPSRLHTNACGDFTLMGCEAWRWLHGYPELAMFSFHLDSVLCHAAHHAGFRERALLPSMPVYHIEHAAGSGFTPEGQKQLTARLDAARIPQLDHAQLDAWAIQMRRTRRPIVFNGEDWGLAGEPLAEQLMEA